MTCAEDSNWMSDDLASSEGYYFQEYSSTRFVAHEEEKDRSQGISHTQYW